MHHTVFPHAHHQYPSAALLHLLSIVLVAVLLDKWAILQHGWAKGKEGDLEGVCDVEAANGQPPLRQSRSRAPGAAVALLHSDAERREFISAGAAAGLAVRHTPALST